jgi:hypothetical protein
MYLGGKGTFEDVAKAAARTVEAQLDTPNSNRVQILEKHVAIARDLEKASRVRFDSGFLDASAMSLATYMRLDMELKLAREKQAAKSNAK